MLGRASHAGPAGARDDIGSTRGDTSDVGGRQPQVAGASGGHAHPDMHNTIPCAPLDLGFKSNPKPQPFESSQDTQHSSLIACQVPV